MLTPTETKISQLFKELVPDRGTADTVAGEIIRAISRIAYRKYNDGDQVGIGYGKETCNPAARYLISIGDKAIEDAVYNLWGVYSDKKYDKLLAELEDIVLAYVEAHPELKTTKNVTDMWDCRTDEDVDDDEDDDEDWY